MHKLPVDINCDLGEGVGVEEAIMPLIGSANIACGAHAGDAATINHCLDLALEHEVKIGLHPSYPDRENFGRKVMSIHASALKDALKNQIDTFLNLAEKKGATIHHVKLHGALYNEAAKNKSLAALVIDVLYAYQQPWILYCPPKSNLQQMAIETHIKTWGEAFLDRNYQADGSLVSRQQANSTIQETSKVIERFENLYTKKALRTIDDEWISLPAETYCIHGDHPQALNFLRSLLAHYTDGKI